MSKRSKVERVPYNGIPLKEGEVLVPMLVDEDFIRINEVSGDKIRRWRTAGVEYEVVFFAVPEQSRDMAMSQYYSTVNDMLDRVMGGNRDSRCLIPQEDGSIKICPKKHGHNRPACKDCPNQGKFEKAKKTSLSLDAIRDQLDMELPATNDTEEEALLPITLLDMMDYLRENDERVYTALKLRFKGKEKKDVIMALMEKYGIKRSRAYDIYADAKNKLNEFINL